LKGITVSALHSSSDFAVKVASNFKSIHDLDIFGEIVQFNNTISVRAIETSYFEPFFSATIFTKTSPHSEILIS
jgi:hypothetical protein